jgi:hypothetical protein
MRIIDEFSLFEMTSGLMADAKQNKLFSEFEIKSGLMADAKQKSFL